MTKAIVTTTINPPTKAIERFDRMDGWKLIVIGDLKTPKTYRLDNGVYVGPEEQEKYDKELSDTIGWNSIRRRNFGLLWAHDMGAQVIAIVDDDNIPYEEWGEDLFLGKNTEVNYYETDLPAFDPVGATNHPHIWHRGYPLQLLPRRDYTKKSKRMVRPDVQADFWDGDPDIDAICRLEHAPECKFQAEAFPLASNRMSPFNSQNTFLRGDALADYFLFPHVGRMDDIWASYYLQAKGHQVVYGRPSVYQDRNEHNLVEDMKQEYLGYEYNLNIVRDLQSDPESIVKYLPGRSVRAWVLYRRHFTHA